MKIETVFIIACLGLIVALGAIAYAVGGKCHEEPPTDARRVEAGGYLSV